MGRKRSSKSSFKVEQIEAMLDNRAIFEFAGSGDPHEEYGKVRLLLENLKSYQPDLILFDGDYLARPAYLKADADLSSITKQCVGDLQKLLKELVDAPSPVLCVAGNYEIPGTTYDAVEAIGCDSLLDIGCDKKASPQQDRLHPDDIYMHLSTARTTWPGGTYKAGGFTFVGVEGSNPINATFPGERTEENIGWALQTPIDQLTTESDNLIVATHSPPFGFRDRLGRFGVPQNLWGTHKGSVALRNFADSKRPFMILVGHIHEAFGIHIRSEPKNGGDEADQTILDKDFGKRTKILIGYDTSKTSVSITLNKGTLEYWNWSRVRIAEEGNLRVVDIEGEWLDRKSRKKPFKKYSNVVQFDNAIESMLG